MDKKLRLLFLTMLLFLAVVSGAFMLPRTQPGGIILRPEPQAIKPTAFYIANVIDERSERRAVAWLAPFSSESAGAGTIPVDLDGGGISALGRFFKGSVTEDRSLHPVAVRIAKFMVNEHLLPNGQAQGKAVLQLSFDLLTEGQPQHLIDYTGGADYTRNPGPPQEIEPTLRKMLISSISYFNTWINKASANDIRFARSVKVSFSDYNESPEGDTVYYSVNRPLSWSDFKGAIPQSRFAAEVMPTIGFSEAVGVKDGIVELKMYIKVCLPKSACWVRPGAKDDYTLNHEQRHFDLAKIAAENFERKIRSEDLPVGNYDGFINVDYLDAYRQMDTLEKRYDDETQHGIDRYAQQQWNERIDKQLKAFGVK